MVATWCSHTRCRIVCDAKLPAVLFVKSKQEAALIRSGDIVMGHVTLSKAVPSTRAQAAVVLELVPDGSKLALAQQFVSKHEDVATLHQHVKNVAFGDMSDSVQVLGDNRFQNFALFRPIANFGHLFSVINNAISAGAMFICSVTKIAENKLKHSSSDVVLPPILRLKK